MNLFFGRFLDRLPSLLNENPALFAAAILLLGLVIGAKYLTLHYAVRDKATSLNAKRFRGLLAILKSGKYVKAHPLELEITFQRAYGFKLGSDEINFALQRRNTSGLLFAIRYGKSFMQLNEQKSKFVPIRKHKLSFRTREKIVNALIYGFLAPGIYISGLYCLFDLQGGLLLLATFLGGLWCFLVLIRQLACAQRLELLSEQPDLPTVKRRKAAPQEVSPSAAVNTLSIVPDNGTSG